MEFEDTRSTPGAKRLSSTQAQRAGHIAAWESSGMSAAEYAEAHGVRLGNLYAWRRKCTESAPSASPFVPVRISPVECACTAGLRIVLKTPGLECVIEGAGDAQAFATLAGALKREVFDV
jgi:hypothetical protein